MALNKKLVICGMMLEEVSNSLVVLIVRTSMCTKYNKESRYKPIRIIKNFIIFFRANPIKKPLKPPIPKYKRS
jgi:hypothetical protein